MSTNENSENNSTELKLRQTCDACQAIKTRCSRTHPVCTRCQAHDIPCQYSASRRLGRPRRLVTSSSSPSPVLPSNIRSPIEQQQQLPQQQNQQQKQVPVTSQSKSTINPAVAAPWKSIIDPNVDPDRMIITDVCFPRAL
jgi:hypothetical protein